MWALPAAVESQLRAAPASAASLYYPLLVLFLELFCRHVTVAPFIPSPEVNKRCVLPERARECQYGFVHLGWGLFHPFMSLKGLGAQDAPVVLGSRTLCWLAGAGRGVAGCGLAKVRTPTRPPAESLPWPVSGLPCHLCGEVGCCQPPSSGTRAVFHPDSSLRPAAVWCLTIENTWGGAQASLRERVSSLVLWLLFKWPQTSSRVKVCCLVGLTAQPLSWLILQGGHLHLACVSTDQGPDFVKSRVNLWGFRQSRCNVFCLVEKMTPKAAVPFPAGRGHCACWQRS